MKTGSTTSRAAAREARARQTPQDNQGPDTMNGYLASVSADKRAALQRLRMTIHRVVPEAEEGTSYGLAAFRLNGRPLIGFGATKHHCALYPMSSATIKAHQHQLIGFETSKGAIRFQPDKPLPDGLVRKLVRARISELQTAGAHSSRGRKS